MIASNDKVLFEFLSTLKQNELLVAPWDVYLDS